MVTVGGWVAGSANFSGVCLTQQSREDFTINSIAFLRKYNFDGLDISWLYPTFREGGRVEDKENFGYLLQEFYEQFRKESDRTGKPRLLLSVALKPLTDYLEKSFDIPTMIKYVDFINVLSYGYYPGSAAQVNHFSMLYPLLEDIDDKIVSKLNADASIKDILKYGADPALLNMGIATFGRHYTLEDPDENELGSATGPRPPNPNGDIGVLNYYEICERVDSTWTVKVHNKTAMGPYAYKNTDWVSYDDIDSTQRKAEYALKNNIDGLMFWTIDDDDFSGKCHGTTYPLIRAARETFIGDDEEEVSTPSPSPSPTPSPIPTPTPTPTPKPSVVQPTKAIRPKPSPPPTFIQPSSKTNVPPPLEVIKPQDQLNEVSNPLQTPFLDTSSVNVPDLGAPFLYSLNFRNNIFNQNITINNHIVYSRSKRSSNGELN